MRDERADNTEKDDGSQPRTLSGFMETDEGGLEMGHTDRRRAGCGRDGGQVDTDGLG
jgi:hypothetical protein